MDVQNIDKGKFYTVMNSPKDQRRFKVKSSLQVSPTEPTPETDTRVVESNLENKPEV
jgi:hypothetical protein